MQILNFIIITESVSSDHDHRKFSLGSFFGYKGGHSSNKLPAGFLIPSQNRKGFQQQESVILDMGPEYASSDGNRYVPTFLFNDLKSK